MQSVTLARPNPAARSNPFIAAFREFTRRLVMQRTVARLSDLDDRMLRDIGLSRGDLDNLRRRR